MLFASHSGKHGHFIGKMLDEPDKYGQTPLHLAAQHGVSICCLHLIIPPVTKLGGVYWNHPVCLSVRLSVDARLDKMVSSA